jgi:hypothetical protein
MAKQTRKERVELSELKKLIDALIGDVREIKRMILDLQDGLNAVPPQPTMPSSPTDITMQTPHPVEALVDPLTIKPAEEPPIEGQPVEDVKEEQKSEALKPEDHKSDGIF